MNRYALFFFLPVFLLLVGIYKPMGSNTYTSRANYLYRQSSINEEGGQDISIFIDLNERQLYLFKGDQILRKYAVAIGKSVSPSPIGIWKIINMRKNWGSG